jgi:hypothetical protein
MKIRKINNKVKAKINKLHKATKSPWIRL